MHASAHDTSTIASPRLLPLRTFCVSEARAVAVEIRQCVFLGVMVSVMEAEWDLSRERSCE
jgi:hypothetical protein